MNNPAYLYCEGYRAAIEAGNQGAIEIAIIISASFILALIVSIMEDCNAP